MGDSRPEGERNFWNGRESVTAKGSKSPAATRNKPVNTKEADELVFEGGSDLFTSNRHQMPNNNTEFWSRDDSPVIRPAFKAPKEVYQVQRTRRVQLDGYGGEGCEKVTKLNLRTNLAWMKHSLILTAAGLAVFSGIVYLKKDKNPAMPTT